MKFSCRLREEVPDERAVIRWLRSQANNSGAVRAVLIAHVVGQNGISTVAISDKLDRIIRLLESGYVAVGDVSSAEAGPGDGLAYLDELGL